MMVSLIYILALVISIGANAQTYTDEEIVAIALNAQRALDIQAVENLMSRHVLYHCYGEHIYSVQRFDRVNALLHLFSLSLLRIFSAIPALSAPDLPPVSLRASALV